MTLPTPKCAHCLFELLHAATAVQLRTYEDRRYEETGGAHNLRSTVEAAEEGRLLAINGNTYATVIPDTMYKGTWVCAGHLPAAVSGMQP